MPTTLTGPREKDEPRSRRFPTDEAEASRKALSQLVEWRTKAEPQLDQLVEDVAGHTERLDDIDKKLSNHDERFDGTDKRLNRIDAKLDRVLDVVGTSE